MFRSWPLSLCIPVILPKIQMLSCHSKCHMCVWGWKMKTCQDLPRIWICAFCSAEVQWPNEDWGSGTVSSIAPRSPTLHSMSLGRLQNFSIPFFSPVKWHNNSASTTRLKWALIS
jgi:hypothetical protein